MKIIQYLILAAVLFAFDYYCLSGLNAPVVELHRKENMGDWFSGSVLDWLSFALVNGALILYAFLLFKDISNLANPVGGNKWNYIFVTALAFALLLLYIG